MSGKTIAICVLSVLLVSCLARFVLLELAERDDEAGDVARESLAKLRRSPAPPSRKPVNECDCPNCQHRAQVEEERSRAPE